MSDEDAMEKSKEYAFGTVLNISYEEAIVRVTDALKEEGFGVLTEIDVKATVTRSWIKQNEGSVLGFTALERILM